MRTLQPLASFEVFSPRPLRNGKSKREMTKIWRKGGRPYGRKLVFRLDPY